MNAFDKEVKRFLAAQKTTVDEVAQTISIPPRSIYAWSKTKEACRQGKNWSSFEELFKGTEGFERVVQAHNALIEQVKKDREKQTEARKAEVPTKKKEEKKNKAVTPTPVEDKQEAAVPAEPATAAAPSGYVDSQLLFKVFQAAKDKKYESIFTFRLGADWGVETLFQLDQETLEKLMEAIVESKSIRISDFVLFPREATNGQIAYDTGLIISLNGHVQVLTPDGMILKFERSAVIKLGKRINIRRLEVEDCQKGGTQ